VTKKTIEQEALLQAAAWFDAYAESHERQPGKEQHAIRNRARAQVLRLIAEPPPGTITQRLNGQWRGISSTTGFLAWGPFEP
jgi:hypothetical protein